MSSWQLANHSSLFSIDRGLKIKKVMKVMMYKMAYRSRCHCIRRCLIDYQFFFKSFSVKSTYFASSTLFDLLCVTVIL